MCWARLKALSQALPGLLRPGFMSGLAWAFRGLGPGLRFGEPEALGLSPGLTTIYSNIYRINNKHIVGILEVFEGTEGHFWNVQHQCQLPGWVQKVKSLSTVMWLCVSYHSLVIMKLTPQIDSLMLNLWWVLCIFVTLCLNFGHKISNRFDFNAPAHMEHCLQVKNMFCQHTSSFNNVLIRQDLCHWCPITVQQIQTR